MEEIDKLQQKLNTILINSKTTTVQIDEENNEKITTEMYLIHNDHSNLIFYTLKLVSALTEKIKELSELIQELESEMKQNDEVQIIPPPPTPDESIPPPPPILQPILTDVKNLTPLVLPPSLISQPIKNSLTL